MRKRLLGGVVNAYLGRRTRQLKRGLHGAVRKVRGGRRRIGIYHQLDDPHSTLLLQTIPSWNGTGHCCDLYASIFR